MPAAAIQMPQPSRYFGFHSRASFCASATCAGVNCAATISRAFTAFLFLLAAAKLSHMCWYMTPRLNCAAQAGFGKMALDAAAAAGVLT
jgi:hypothetical protein